ncbi:hypothetical protein Dimus_025047 [Dionaea muscipula]
MLQNTVSGTDRSGRVNAMRTAILETFPEPNRRLLQRILRMMQNVVSHKTVNRMSTSAVAACMAPLLLRPLLAGDCEVENHHFDVAGDGSFQLLQAAAAANHAQAIIITLLDEYENIFGAGTVSPELFSDTEESGSATEATDEDDLYDDDDNEYGTEDHEGGTDDDYDHSASATCTEIGDDEDDESYNDKRSERSSIVSKSPERDDEHESIGSSPSSRSSTPRYDSRDAGERAVNKGHSNSVAEAEVSIEAARDVPAKTNMVKESAAHGPSSCQKSASSFHESGEGMRRPRWGRTAGQKNLSMESIDFTLAEEEEIQMLEAAKNELQNRIAEEVNENAILQAGLEERKKALHQRRLALEKDVARLQEQLQKERDLRAALEAGLGIGQVPVSAGIDEKTKAELHEIAVAEEDLNSLKQRFHELEMQLKRQREQNLSHQHDRNIPFQEASSKGTIQINKQKENENVKTNKQKDNESTKITKQKDDETTAAAIHNHERSIKTKEQESERADGGHPDNEKIYEIASLANKTPNQQNDVALGINSRPGPVPISSSSVDALAPKPTSSSNPKKSTKGEGINSSASALSKLTTRLNFLKERRNQIASELQDLDKNKDPVQSPRNPEKGKGGSESYQSMDKNQGSEASIVQNPRDSGSQPLLQDKMIVTDSQRNQDINRKGGSSPKSHNLLHQNSDRGRKSEGQQTQQLDRMNLKSEGQSSKNANKGRRSEGPYSSSESQSSKKEDKGRR